MQLLLLLRLPRGVRRRRSGSDDRFGAVGGGMLLPCGGVCVWVGVITNPLES